jgi:hypothetical protein
VPTPLGLVTVSVSAANVVSVHLEPSATNTLVFGLPFSYPPGPPSLPGYARMARFAVPNLAIISIHPGNPCRSRTIGNTGTFTPIYPPGPPG